MARTRRPGHATAGADTILAELAEHFRLGQFAARVAPAGGAGGRPRLGSTAEIIEQIRELNLAPTAAQGAIVSVDFICWWEDVDTGEIVFRLRSNAQGAVGTVRSTLHTRARRNAQSRFAHYQIFRELAGRNLRQHCRKIQGSEFIIPAG